MRKVKKILLIDVDSKIPNLALMKLSAYHKSKGDNVLLDWYFGKYDVVYASCIFKENKNLLRELPFANVIKGGSGTEDWSITLPDHVEHIMPDYDLYHSDYSMGFVSRGCFRACEYCIVPSKEGKLRENADIYEFWDKRHKNIVLLDNNILGLQKHFFKICEQILKENLIVDFNQGLDIRLMDNEFAKILKSLRHKEYKFAFDNMKDEEAVKTGIETLKRYGINRNTFYVLVGFDTNIRQDLYRLNALKELGQNAYVMRYKKDRKYVPLAQWANQHNILRTHTFEEFCKKKYKYKKIEEIMEV